MPATKTIANGRAPLAIPAPRSARVPLKVNVFRHMRMSNTALCPMFPYLDEGCFVPAVAVYSGAPGRAVGMFKHFNTVDEVLVVFGAKGSRLKAGNAIADVREHFVNIALSDFNDPDNYFLAAIIQRQSENREDQREVVTFVCEQCKKPLREFPFQSQPPVGASAGLRDNPEYARGFESPIGAWRAAEQFNGDEQGRRCTHCGHVSAPFPFREWGWEKYAEQCRAVGKALQAYPGLQEEPANSTENLAVRSAANA
jgi:hypothetical protein